MLACRGNEGAEIAITGLTVVEVLEGLAEASLGATVASLECIVGIPTSVTNLSGQLGGIDLSNKRCSKAWIRIAQQDRTTALAYQWGRAMAVMFKISNTEPLAPTDSVHHTVAEDRT